jgi:hypothetical protein
LVLLAGRELLRVGREDLVVMLAVLAAIGLTVLGAPQLVGAVGVLGLAIAAGVHASAAATRRTAPGSRQRIMLLTLFVLASISATVAVLSRVELAYLAGALAS